MKRRLGPVWIVWATCVAGAIVAAPSAWAQPPEVGFGGLDLGLGDRGDQHMRVSARFTVPAGGRPARLFVTATLDPGWYTYSLTQPRPNQPTKIEPKPSAAYHLLGDFVASSPPKTKSEQIGKKTYVSEAHYGRVTWSAPIELAPGIDPKTFRIEGVLTAQRCDDNKCLPATRFPFTAALGPGEAIGGPSPEVSSPPAPPAVRSGASGAARQPATENVDVFDSDDFGQSVALRREEKTLLPILALGFLGGIILNLMPCVLPVIGLKLFSFVEQAGHDRRTSLVLNLWYSLGLLSVFWLLAALAVGLKLGWGQQFQHSGFNVFLAAVVFTMGLSFLGVWEFPIPGFVGRGSTAALAEKEGVAGAFFKGVITTVLATPCTGPFMGGALAWALKQSPLEVFAVFTSVGLGMASPYLMIGGLPELIRFLPKPGAWMDTFKQIMGFVLLGTVVYIFTFLEISYVVPAVGLLFALWAACWWIARTPPTAELGAKVRAWLEAAAWVGVMWILLFPGIDELVPKGLADRGFRGPSGLHEIMVARLSREDDFWRRFTTKKDLARLILDDNTVMVTFTADWCLTCKALEATVLSSEAVRKAVQDNRVIAVKADYTREDPEIGAMLDRLVGAQQVPVLAIFPAGKPKSPIAFVDGYTQKMVLEALEKAGPSK